MTISLAFDHLLARPQSAGAPFLRQIEPARGVAPNQLRSEAAVDNFLLRPCRWHYTACRFRPLKNGATINPSEYRA
jgi:hypothetical protein